MPISMALTYSRSLMPGIRAIPINRLQESFEGKVSSDTMLESLAGMLPYIKDIKGSKQEKIRFLYSLAKNETLYKGRTFDIMLGKKFNEIGPFQVMPFHLENIEKEGFKFDLTKMWDTMRLAGILMYQKIKAWKGKGKSFNLSNIDDMSMFVRSWNAGVEAVSKNSYVVQDYWDRFKRNWATSSWITGGKVPTYILEDPKRNWKYVAIIGGIGIIIAMPKLRKKLGF